MITILYCDCPETLPSNVADFLFQLGEHLPDDNLYLFESFLDRFVADFFLPISPYNSPYNPLRPTQPPTLPFTPANPFTIPLVYTEQ